MGIHGHAANLGTPSLPATATGLAELLAVMEDVADLTDTGPTALMKLTNLTGGQLDKNIIALLGHQLRRRTGGTNQLGTLADLHLNIMDDGTQGQIRHGQAVAELDIDIVAGLHDIADLDALGERM